MIAVGVHGRAVFFLARTEGGGTWLMTLCDQAQLMVSLQSHPPTMRKLLV